MNWYIFWCFQNFSEKSLSTCCKTIDDHEMITWECWSQFSRQLLSPFFNVLYKTVDIVPLPVLQGFSSLSFSHRIFPGVPGFLLLMLSWNALTTARCSSRVGTWNADYFPLFHFRTVFRARNDRYLQGLE